MDNIYLLCIVLVQFLSRGLSVVHYQCIPQPKEEYKLAECYHDMKDLMACSLFVGHVSSRIRR